MSEFKPISSIPGYEEYTEHEMDIYGTIRRDGRVLKWQTVKGYLQFTLRMNGNHKGLKQHRAIALLFIPNPDNKPCVDHCNGNRCDNRVENLRWCTYSENNHNRTAQCDNVSGYKNIYKHCQQGKYWCWKIQIILNGKKFTKSFKCLQDDTEPPAEVIAYRDQMLREHHGEFASL